MRYPLVYGGLAGAIVIGVITLSFAFDLPNHFQSEWFGYLVMLTSLSLLFVGVKRYRDIECGGVIGFGRALALGLGIAAVAGLTYVMGWEIYLAATGWDFMADYSAGLLDRMRAEGASPAAVQAQADQLREMAAMYEKPWFRLPMTFVEIFPVGAVVALVSAALLRNPRLLPATVR